MEVNITNNDNPGKSAITDVVIPDSVIYINGYAFNTWLTEDQSAYDVTIHCRAGSYAETFAKGKGIPYVTDMAS